MEKEMATHSSAKNLKKNIFWIILLYIWNKML